MHFNRFFFATLGAALMGQVSPSFGQGESPSSTHAEAPEPSNLPPATRGQDILDKYFAANSPLKKIDREAPSLKDTDIAVHLFQIGPDHQSLFPELEIRTGKNCETPLPLEFATRLERDASNKLHIAQLSLLVGPSYEFKVRTDPKTGHKKINLTDTILGELGLTHLDAGSFSTNFASPRLQELMEAGRVQIRPVLDSSSQKIQSYQVISDGITKTFVPELSKTSSLSFADPDSGQPLSATLMPYATFFAPRDQGLLESKAWGIIAPTGTAIHGTDLSHLAPRSLDENLGSAGCARVENDFARSTYSAILSHLKKHGAEPRRDGSSLDILESDQVQNGKLSGQRIVESSQNINNLEALLKSREKISIVGFAAQTPAQMKEYYHKLFHWQLIEIADKGAQVPNDRNDLKAILATCAKVKQDLQDAKIAYELSSNQKEEGQGESPKEGAYRIYQAVQMAKERVRLALGDSLQTLAKYPDKSELDPKIQKLLELARKWEEMSKTSKAQAAAAQLPLHGMNPEVADFYNTPANKAALYSQAANAIDAFYKATYNNQVPPACRALVESYRQRSQDLISMRAPRALSVTE